MNIIEVAGFGGPEVLTPRTAPDPRPGPGQVVVAVSVVDVLSIDARLRAGWGQEWSGTRPPFVPGSGAAGRVLDVGEGVDRALVGKRVAGRFAGAYAEQIVAGVDDLVEVPDGLDLRQAAALIQVGPAALSLVDAAALLPSHRVLVIGAGGGLGLALVHRARAEGAHVTAAARGQAKQRAAQEAGATDVVDYDDIAGEFDVVFDGVGGAVGTRAFDLVAPDGVFFAYGVASGSPAQVRAVGMEQVQFTPEEFRAFASRALAEALAGRLTTVIGMAVPLDRAAEAHAALESRALVGKAVLMATGRAARHSRYGDADVLTVEEIPIPRPGPGQVRVAVRAAGVNGIDWKIRRGLLGGPLDQPTGTGIELAGTVDALGDGVTRWRVGDRVFGPATNAAATHALADADALMPIPDDLTYPEAAALPIATATAHRVLTELALEPGHTLLIHAVAGGVGLAAAQLALAKGVAVVGTASERHHDRLRELGVAPVTYGEGLADRITRPVDRVLDASGRGVLPVSIKLTGDPAKVITIADPQAGDHGVRFSRGGGPRTIDASVRIPVAEVFPLERIADAHRRSEEGHYFGKLVVSVD